MVAHYNTHNLFRVDFQHRRTDAVARFEDRYFATVRGVEREIYVMYAIEGMAEFLIKFDYDFLCHLGDCRYITHAGADNTCAVVLNVGYLDDCEVKVAEETVTQLLCCFRKVKVKIVCIV